MPEFICEACDRPFVRGNRSGQPARYCSNQCSGIGKRTKPATAELICETCDQPFMRRNQHGPAPKFCDECKLKVKRAAQARYRANPAKRAIILASKGRAETELTPVCQDCRKPYDRQYRRGRAPMRCESCRAAWNAKRRAATQLRSRCAAKGITIEQYQAALASQGDKCAVCRSEFGLKGPQIDHDHTCCPTQKSCGRCFRGLLCGGCNLGIGSMRENVITIQAAAEYVLNGGFNDCRPAGELGGLVVS